MGIRSAILQKIKDDEESALNAGKANRDREERLRRKETKSKEWMHKRSMDLVFRGMENLELETLDGEWREHDLIRHEKSSKPSSAKFLVNLKFPQIESLEVP